MNQCHACKHLYQSQCALTMHINHSRYCMDKYYEFKHQSILPTLLDIPVMFDNNTNINNNLFCEEIHNQEIALENDNSTSINDGIFSSESDNYSCMSQNSPSYLFHDNDINHEIQ